MEHDSGFSSAFVPMLVGGYSGEPKVRLELARFALFVRRRPELLHVNGALRYWVCDDRLDYPMDGI